MQRDCSGRPLRLFLTFYRPHRRLFALDLLFSLLSCLADLAFPYVSRQAMQHLLPLGLFRTFFAIMAALLAAYLLKAVFKYAVTVIGHQCGVLIEADMRQELFEHLQTMSFRFFDCNRTGVLMSRMTSDLFSITELAHHGPEYLLTAVVTLGGALAILAPICWQLALVLLLLVPLSLWITIRQRKRMNDANVAVKRRQAEINTVIESGISGVRTAKAFTNEAVEREKFLACNDRYKHSKTDWYRAMGVFQGGMEFTMSAMQVVVIALGGAYIMRGQIDYIDLITFSLYVTTFISPIRTLVNFMEVFTDGTAGFQRFLELMRVQPDIADAPDARPLPTVRGQVDYNDVSFDYAEGATVLSHVDLHIAPGETLAVVGPSGGGKTTLCQLLPRFYDVTSGSVCIDGIDVRTVTQASLRRCVGVLQQEVFLFADTIRENIVALYAKKTGKSTDQCGKWMDETNWWTAAQAKENGFIDEVDDEESDAVVENRNGVLFVNSIGMGLPFDKAPDFVKSRMGKQPGGFSNSANNPGKTGTQEEKTMAIENKNDLVKAYPDMVNEIKKDAAVDAINRERARIKDIQDMTMPGMEKTMQDALYGEHPMDATQYAKEVAKFARKQAEDKIKGLHDDAQSGGANSVNSVDPGNQQTDIYLDALRAVSKKQ